MTLDTASGHDTDTSSAEEELGQFFKEAVATLRPADDAPPAPADAPAPETPPAEQEDTAPEVETLPEEDWRQRAEQAEQRMRSWEGRLSKSTQQNKALAERLAKMEAALAEAEARRAAEHADPLDSFHLDDADKAEARELLTAYPVLGKLLISQRHDVPLPRADTPASEAPAPQAEESSPDTLAMIEHFSAIAAKQPQWQQKVNSDTFRAWVESRPYREALDYQRIYQQGTAAEVVKMLDAYDSHRKQDVPAQAPKGSPQGQADTRSPQVEKRTRQLQDLTAVPHRRTVLPREAPDVNDEQAAWEEAVAALRAQREAHRR